MCQAGQCGGAKRALKQSYYVYETAQDYSYCLRTLRGACQLSRPPENGLAHSQASLAASRPQSVSNKHIMLRRALCTLQRSAVVSAVQDVAAVAAVEGNSMSQTSCNHVVNLSRQQRPREAHYSSQHQVLWNTAAAGLQYFHSSAAPWGSVVSFPLAQTGEGISECELMQWFVKVCSTDRQWIQYYCASAAAATTDTYNIPLPVPMHDPCTCAVKKGTPHKGVTVGLLPSLGPTNSLPHIAPRPACACQCTSMLMLFFTHTLCEYSLHPLAGG